MVVTGSTVCRKSRPGCTARIKQTGVKELTSPFIPEIPIQQNWIWSVWYFPMFFKIHHAFTVRQKSSVTAGPAKQVVGTKKSSVRLSMVKAARVEFSILTPHKNTRTRIWPFNPFFQENLQTNLPPCSHLYLSEEIFSRVSNSDGHRSNAYVNFFKSSFTL